MMFAPIIDGAVLGMKYRKASIFTQNIVLTYFWGICPFVAVSKEIPTASGIVNL